MAVSNAHYLDKILLASTEIQTLGNASLDAGVMSLVERGAGEVLANFIATQDQKPKIQFASPDLSTVLGIIPLTGAAFATATFYLKLGATTGRVARATASHKRVAATTCHAHWTSIKLTHNGRAEIDVVITPIYDGTNAPFILTGTVALSGTMDAQAFHRAGPAYINDTLVGAIKEMTITSGIQLVEESSDGEVYLTYVATKTAEPTIEVQTLGMINWATGITLTGTALDGTDGFLGFARKYAADGQMVANGTAEHISFAALTGRVIPMNTQGQGSDILSDRFKVEVRGDLTIDTTAAIP